MTINPKLNFPPLINRIQQILSATPGVYLVGGVVRDTLLDRPIHDIDIVLEQNALRTARKVANALGGSYYTMDSDFGIGRIVLPAEEGEARTVLDFASLQGDTLEADLRNRDFTINAMAVDIHQPGELIDPLGGAGDLMRHALNTCSPTSLVDDPVRVLRAVRMAAAFQLTLSAQTRGQVADALARLDTVSIERQRDEFFKLLDAPKPTASLRALDLFGVLDVLLPELAELKGVTQSSTHIYDVWEHSLHTVEALDQTLSRLSDGYVHDNEDGGDVFSGVLSQQLGRYRKQFTAHLQTALSPERSLRALLLFAALCHDIAKPRHRVEDNGEIHFPGHEAGGAKVMKNRAAVLRLSNSETQRLYTIINNHNRPWQLAKLPDGPTRQDIYRFWRDTGEAGVDICLLADADLRAIFGYTLWKETYQNHTQVLRTLLEAYFEHPEQVNPPMLLDGRQMMETLHLKPGPKVGELLEALREAQAVGEISTLEEAIPFLQKLL